MGKEITITVFDEDIAKNDVVGSVVILKEKLCVEPGLDTWFDLTYGKKNKSAGKIHIFT